MKRDPELWALRFMAKWFDCMPSKSAQINPEAAGEAIRLLEIHRKRVADVDLKEAIDHDAWARQNLLQAQDTAESARNRRFEVESLIAQLDLAIAGLVRP